MNARMLMALTIVTATCLPGCEKKPASTTPAPSKTAQSAGGVALPASLFLAKAPEGAKEVKVAKAAAKVGDTVVVHGRIGGSEEPFVEGRAVFTLMDMELKPCNATPGDTCETPWDYCCDGKDVIAAHAATIQVTDASGAPLKVALKGSGGLKELSELIVVGKVAQAEAGKVLVVNAEGIFRKDG